MMMIALMDEFISKLPSGVEVEMLDAGHLYVMPDIPGNENCSNSLKSPFSLL